MKNRFVWIGALLATAGLFTACESMDESKDNAEKKRNVNIDVNTDQGQYKVKNDKDTMEIKINKPATPTVPAPTAPAPAAPPAPPK